MSPTNPSDQAAQEKLEREFDDFLRADQSRVAAAYRKLPRSEPAAALDLRIRALAQEPLLDGTVAQEAPRTSRRSPSWLPALSAAAIVVLAAGVVWRIAPQMWSARNSDSTGATTRLPVAVDAPPAQSAGNANDVIQSAGTEQLGKNRKAAEPGALAAPPQISDKLAPPPAPPAGGATNARGDKIKTAQPQPSQPAELRRERMQPAAPSPFPGESAAGPTTATLAAPAPKPRPPLESTPAPAKASPAPSASPSSILDGVVNATPAADGASAVRSEPATAAAKTLPSTPSAQSFAQSPRAGAGAAAALPLAPPADSAPNPPVAATRSPAVTDFAMPSEAPSPVPTTTSAPPPPPPPPAPPQEKISSHEQTRYQRRLQEHAAESPIQWIERIRTLLRDRQRDEAMWNLRAFRKQYPAIDLPADLRDLK